MFGFTNIDTNEKITRLITNNKRLHQTKFYIGKRPAITLVKSGNSFTSDGFFPAGAEVRIMRRNIEVVNRLKMIEVKVANRTKWVPINRLATKTWVISWRKYNDTFIDEVNSAIQSFHRAGVMQPKLCVIDSNANNVVFGNIVQAVRNKKRSETCGYIIEGFRAGLTTFPQSLYIRVIDGQVEVKQKDIIGYAKVFVEYLDNFVDKDKVLTTNVAYTLADSAADWGKFVFGPKFSASGMGSGDCADLVFYGAPTVDTDDMSGSIILRPTSSSTNDLTFIRRDSTLPSPSNFAFVAIMKPDKNITRIKKIRQAYVAFTFAAHVNTNPLFIKKYGRVGPIPPPVPGTGGIAGGGPGGAP